jgi:trans-aconitate methyltransferase
MSRSGEWHPVWDRRDPGKVEFNGCEACFPDLAAYRAFVAAEARLVTDLLRFGPDDRVLDMGCGTGLLTSMVAPQVRWVLALDYSHDALEVARTKHPSPNIEYRRADLGRLDPQALDVDKAYAVGSLHYLDNYETVRGLLAGLSERGVEIVVLDVPDEQFRSEVTREYDTARWSHLCFEEARLRADFPRVTILRGRFPEYSNDAVRFSFHLTPEPAGPASEQAAS